ncbi:MAG TPA: DUF4172 domain-containing protein, partial [Candidatus Berkiella sp.]|nr:DUF4172 domain-containing protein [Candidatus Berkiella sp.]
MPDWPDFRYDLSCIDQDLLIIAEKAGFIRGKLTHLSSHLQTEALIAFMVEEAIKTSEIEGEYISRSDVRSSIKKRLSIDSEKVQIQDKRAQGIVDMMFDVRDTFNAPISDTHLFKWHLMLLSSSYDPNLKIASWRT